ncbi:3-oxoacyl-[acyl-carrier-protein] reductase FabG [Gimesia panareensis]|uniref:3-oxoacyl-[acyl-carrier-protein] reductase FabG n=1 Tax=Gimesia panareensis TaxID=2527978 RepID=A0A518FIY0_9PLAN|nr:SDR family oxidoreductase [Gimesia panareensis]QDV16308.1 3-oxoacyl-[acyl-carrier-protein] reductase FabG [Gimesia panareensis]
MNLEGKVAVITGSAVRIGRSMALALAEAGADICIHYHSSAQAAEETCDEIRQRGRKAISVSADLSQPVSAADTIFSAVMSELGRVDVLINSASVFENKTLKEATETDWDAHLDINLKAPFFLCQKYAALLCSNQPGHIVNIVDWRARRAGIGHLPYRISKAGLVTLTECLALELAPEVQVNAIAPGAILPPPGKDQSYLDQRAAGVPLKCAGTPAEICQAVLYLLHSDFVTGEVLTVSGGEQFTAGA